MANQVLLKTAGEVMTSPAVTVPASATLADAAEIMVEKNIGCLPVVDKAGKLVGVVTERTFQSELAGYRPTSAMSSEERVLAQLYISGGSRLGSAETWFEQARRSPITDAMLTDEPIVEEATPLHEVAAAMLKVKLSHIVVTRDGAPVGVVARHDLLKAFVNA
jgi:CBS domain-containing protein